MTRPNLNNVGEKEYKVEDEHFATLETLPPALRKVIANAPYPFSVYEIAGYYQQLRATGMEEGKAANIIIERFNKFIAQRMKEMVLKDYGPEHPQAGHEDGAIG